MKVLSASQAVAPAIERTRHYLFRPFDWGMYLKLAAVACITEGFWAGFNFSASHSTSSDSTSFSAMNLSTEAIAAAIFAVVTGVGLGILFYYVVIRLRFAFFHCLVHGTREIRPAWARYHRQSMRLFVASLLVWLAFLVMVLMMAGAVLVVVFTVFTVRTADGKLDPGVFFILFYPCLGFAFLVGLLGVAAAVVLHDFVLPHMAIENATFREAWAAARSRILAGKEVFFSYFILRLVLPVLATIALLIAAGIPLAIAFWILSTSATGFHDMLEDATGLGAVFRVFFAVLFGAIGIGFGLLATFGLGGPIATWIRNYALLFYSGRYKALGEILEPPAA
jgi:hypothetical protein